MTLKLRMNDGLLYTLHDHVPLDPSVWATLDTANYRINLSTHPNEPMTSMNVRTISTMCLLSKWRNSTPP